MDACFSSRSTNVISTNNLEIIDYVSGPNAKLQVIDAFMTPADATVPGNVGLWAVGIRLTGSATMASGNSQMSRDQISAMSVTADVSAVGLLAVAEYFNPDGISGYQCPDWGVDSADQTQSCRTHFTRTADSPSMPRFTTLFVANPVTGQNVTSVRSSARSGSFTIYVSHIYAQFECTFYTGGTDPFSASCEATQSIFEPSVPQASLAFIFGGRKFSTLGVPQSFSGLDDTVMNNMIDSAFKNQQTVVDQSFFQVKNDSNFVITTVPGPFGNETIPYLFINVLNPNKVSRAKKAYYSGNVKSSVLFAGPSVLLASPQNKKNRTPIIIASVIIVAVILIIAAVVILLWIKHPEKFPSWMARKTEETSQYTLYT